MVDQEGVGVRPELPVVLGDTVLVNSGERMVGLSIGKGEVLWSTPLQILTQRLVGAGDRAYSADHAGRVYAFDKGGKRPWTTKPPNPENMSGYPPSLRIVDGRVYSFSAAKDGAGTEDFVTVLDKSGETVGSFALDKPCVMGSEALTKEDGKLLLHCATTDETQENTSVLRQELAKGADSKTTRVKGSWGFGQVGAAELSVTKGKVLLLADSELVAVDPVAGRSCGGPRCRARGFPTRRPSGRATGSM